MRRSKPSGTQIPLQSLALSRPAVRSRLVAGALASAVLLGLAGCASAPKTIDEQPVIEAQPRIAPPVAGAIQDFDVPESFDDWVHSENTPVLRAAELVAPALLRGPYHQVNPRVPVSGGMGIFTLHTPFGRMEAEGVEMLAIRVSELPAIDKLAGQSQFRTFADSAGQSAVRTGQAVAQVVGDPAGTIAGIPAGIARLARSTYRTVRRVTLDATDAARDRMDQSDEYERVGDESAAERNANRAADTAETLTLRYIGYNRARRDLAARLEVDPYTTNPLLNAQLDELAWGGLAGRISFGAMLGAAGAVAQVASVSGRLHRLVWEATPQDIRDRNERELARAGFEGPRVRAFLRNRHFHPSLEIEFTDILVSLDGTEGRWALIDMAAEVESEVEARFLVNVLRMTDAYRRETSRPIERITIEDGVVWLSSGRERPLVLAPVDYVSATPWLERMLSHPELIGRRPTLRIAGLISDEARSRLDQAGWRVEPNSPFRNAPPYRG